MIFSVQPLSSGKSFHLSAAAIYKLASLFALGLLLGAVFFVDSTLLDPFPDQISSQDAEKLASLLPRPLAAKLQLARELPSRYTVTRDADGILSLHNPMLAHKVDFLPDGIEFKQTNGVDGFSMSLQAYGYRGNLQTIQSVVPRYRDNAVFYQRDKYLIEWYASTEAGLEQFFTIMEPPPAASGDKFLELRLFIGGSTKSELINGVLTIKGTTDQTIYYYKDLFVFDANGMTLTAEFVLQDGRFSILVDTTNAIFPITVDPLFSKENTLKSGDTVIDDRYGIVVDVDGDTAVVSAMFADFPDPNDLNKPPAMLVDPGAVYVYTRQNSESWTLQQKLTAIGPAPVPGPWSNGWFGFGVAISGNTIMVNSPFSNSAPVARRGDTIYVFERTAGVWNRTDFLTDMTSFANSHNAMAIDGNTAVLGNNNIAYVYTRSAVGTWMLQASLTAPNGVNGDRFGAAVSIKGDTIVVGASAADLGSGATALVDAGAVYVFEKPLTGWVTTSAALKITAQDFDTLTGKPVDNAGASDGFGVSVDFDGSTIIVGASNAVVNTTTDAGAAYLYTWNGGSLTLEAKLSASDVAVHQFANFGSSVTISGTDVMIGSPLVRGPRGQAFGGAIYHFKKIGLAWLEQKKIFPSLTVVGGAFGSSAALSGNTFIAGGPSDNFDRGQANIYESSIDLSIVKNDSVAGLVTPNTPFSYELIVSNLDPALTANAVRVTDKLPMGVSVSKSVGCVSVPAINTTYTCDFGNLLPGTSKSASISVTVATAGSVTNTASLAATQFDPILSNNKNSVTTVVNTSPQGVSQNVNVLQDSFVDIILTGTDTDQDPIKFLNPTAPRNGTLSGAAPNIRYTPTSGFFGTDSFNFVVTDGIQESQPATVSITIDWVNSAPNASSDSYSVNEGAVLEVLAPGLLLNDKDPDGDAMSISAIPGKAPIHGSLSLATDGSFVYRHDGSETLSDSFIYSVSDVAGLSSTATVNITVVAVNEAPLASAQTYTADEGALLSIMAPGLLTNATDPDVGDVLSVVGMVGNVGPSNGSITVNADGSFSYQHNGGETRSDSFSYQIRDIAGLVSSAIVNLSINAINDAPIAGNDSFGVDEAGNLNVAAPGLLINDSDAENSILQVSTTIVSAPSNGTLVLAVDGSFSYTHDGSETLNDSFEYSVSDGLLSAVATVSIGISPINDAPVANDDSQTTSEDTPFTGKLVGTDAENTTISFVITRQPTKGRVSVDPLTGAFSYLPNQDKNGVDVFAFKVNDGLLDSAEAMVNVSITPSNDLAIASNGNLMVIEDLMINGVLVATDVDGDTLTYKIPTSPTKGSVKLDTRTGAYSYTPGLNLTGADSFTFVANDGTADSNLATVSINISLLPDSPIASPASFVVDEDVTLNQQLSAIDPDGDVVSYFVDVQPMMGNLILDSTTGSFTYTPDINKNGMDSFEYHVSDGLNFSAIAKVSLLVVNTNDAPIANDGTLSASEDTAANDILIANDIDGDNLLFEITTPASKGVVKITNVITGEYRYTPMSNQTGADSFGFRVGDGNLFSNEANVSIDISNLNDPPVADSQDLSIDEDNALSITLTGSDAEKDVLTFSIADLPDRGKLSGDAPNLVYTPNKDVDGTDSFIFTVTDSNGASHKASISIIINSINDAPLASLGKLQTQQDQAASSQLIATDVDGDVLSYSLDSPPSKGEITWGDNGQFIYLPNTGEYGRDQFTYTVSDSKFVSDTARVTIDINAFGNTAPSQATLVAPTMGASDTATEVVFIWNKSTDIDGNTLSYQIQYCDSALLDNCDPIEVNPQKIGLYLNLGGATTGMILFGLLGANRRRRFYTGVALVAIIILLNACSKAADEASAPLRILDTQISYTATNLSPATTYYWKIQTHDGRGGVAESEVARFTTM